MLVSGGGFVIRGVPFHQQFGGEGFAAHVLQTPLVRNVTCLARPSGQIDPEDTARKAVEAPRVGHEGGLVRTTKKAPPAQTVSYIFAWVVG